MRTKQDTSRVSSSLFRSPYTILTRCLTTSYVHPQAVTPFRTLPECPHRHFFHRNTPIDHFLSFFSLMFSPPRPEASRRFDRAGRQDGHRAHAVPIPQQASTCLCLLEDPAWRLRAADILKRATRRWLLPAGCGPLSGDAAPSMSGQPRIGTAAMRRPAAPKSWSSSRPERQPCSDCRGGRIGSRQPPEHTGWHKWGQRE